MKVTASVVILFTVFPVGTAFFLIFGKSFRLRLVIWFAFGYFSSQWMQAMIFVFHNRLRGNLEPAKLNFYYFFHIDWRYALLTGFLLSVLLTIILIIICTNPKKLSLRFLTFTLLVALILSQAAGSSIPKMVGEASMTLFFLLGIFTHHFFLTHPDSITVSTQQLQSDALTTLGLLIGVISIITPFLTMLAALIWKYFSDDQLFQFQITRFAAFVFWNMISIAIIGYECLKILMEVRKKHYEGI